jgi:hypothetical protein
VYQIVVTNQDTPEAEYLTELQTAMNELASQVGSETFPAGDGDGGSRARRQLLVMVEVPTAFGLVEDIGTLLPALADDCTTLCCFAVWGFYHKAWKHGCFHIIQYTHIHTYRHISTHPCFEDSFTQHDAHTLLFRFV